MLKSNDFPIPDSTMPLRALVPFIQPSSISFSIHWTSGPLRSFPSFAFSQTKIRLGGQISMTTCEAQKLPSSADWRETRCKATPGGDCGGVLHSEIIVADGGWGCRELLWILPAVFRIWYSFSIVFNRHFYIFYNIFRQIIEREKL